MSDPPLKVLFPPRTSGGEHAAPEIQLEAPPRHTIDPDEAFPSESQIPKSPRKGRSRKPKTQAKDLKLQKAMKPLVQKCIPDKPPKIAQDNKYAGPPRIAPRSGFQKEQEVYKRSSRIDFTSMPVIREPEEIERLKTEKMVHKLIKYMKKSWLVKVDPTQAEREPIYRTVTDVYTRKPDNWEEIIANREQKSVESGFFCGFDGPYADLVNLEFGDTAMLVFNNLPPDLKISAARWLCYKAKKAEMKAKRDAFLPRLPNNRVRRPNFAKGRLIKDPGGFKLIDEFISIAERFQMLSRGHKSYSRVLADWLSKKEDEPESGVTSGFSVMGPDFRYGFTANRDPENDTNKGQEGGETKDKKKSGEEQIEDKFGPRPDSDRRDPMMDGRKWQREMLQMEYVIYALYDLIKSMLNIKAKNLASQMPLPLEAVMSLRDKSPESKEKHLEKPLTKVPLKRGVMRRMPAFGSRGFFSSAPSNATVQGDDLGPARNNANDETQVLGEEVCTELESKIRATIHDPHANEEAMKNIRNKMNENPLHIHTGDIVNISPVHSTGQVVNELKRIHSLQERMSLRHGSHGGQAKINDLKEGLDHVVQRLGRNEATYGRLFERHKKYKKPLWHDMDVQKYVAKYGKSDSISKIDPTRLSSQDGEAIVDMAIRKRQILPSSRRWPEIDDIPTPTYPFARSPRRIPSEEQSRRDLLKTRPHMDELPPTPVRRLFKMAGVRTTEKQTYNILHEMKKSFRAIEKKVKVYNQNEIMKREYDTLRRYKVRLNAIFPDPVYQWSIAMMRQANKLPTEEDDEDASLFRKDFGGVRRQALWFRKLLEDCSTTGALRHNGCSQALEKLTRYCDIDLKSKHNLIARMALLVISLPTTELGTRHWQYSIQFLLEHLFGVPEGVLLEWLNYRKIPYLIN